MSRHHFSRPPKHHTQKKLEIFDKYFNAWCNIMFSSYRKSPGWKAYKTPYYIDCFSGRGIYDSKDDIKGSPLLAIDRLLRKKQSFEEKNSREINPKVRLIEKRKKWAQELKGIINEEKYNLDIKIFNNDFNEIIESILKEIGFSPAFFFIDPFGIKELKGESVRKIVSKRGPTDIFLIYMTETFKRVKGVAKKRDKEELENNIDQKRIKIIKCIEDFTCGKINNIIENDSKKDIEEYIKNVLHFNNKVPNDVPYLNHNKEMQTEIRSIEDKKRGKVIYYLLFSSRNVTAMKIIRDIFKRSNPQGHLFYT